MRFLLGLVIGMLVGGGGVYLALERPWDVEEVVVETPDAGVEVASKGKKTQRKRKRRAGGGAGGDEVPDLTAADRKMLWKGEAVKLPPRTLDMGSDDSGRPLSAAEINQVIQGQSSGILACVASARGNALLEATVLVKMLVGPDGRAEKIRVRAPAYLFAHGFNPCVRKAARALRFAATGDHTLVEAPYELTF